MDHATKTAAILTASAVIAAIFGVLWPTLWKIAPLIFMMCFSAITLIWRPVLLPGDKPLGQVMSENPAFAAACLMGLVGLFLFGFAGTLLVLFLG